MRWLLLTANLLLTFSAAAQLDDPGFVGGLQRSQSYFLPPSPYTNVPAARYAFPQLGGTKLRVANLSPRPSDSGNGDYGTPASFYALLYQWANDGPTSAVWTEWIKPQIDAMKSQGANAVRFMFDPTLRVGTSSAHGAATWQGTITQAQLLAIIDQLGGYLDTNGMWFYPVEADSRPINQSGLSASAIESYIAEITPEISALPNVNGIDVVQEFDYAGNITSSNYVSSWISTARAALTRPIPLTCSLNGASGASGLNPATRNSFATLEAVGVDYFDCHIYYLAPSITDISPAITNSWGLPVVVSESGIPISGQYLAGSVAQTATHPYYWETGNAMYYQLLALANRYDLQSFGTWASVREYTTDSQDWGLYTNTQNGSYAFTGPRTNLTVIYDQIPTNVQPPNSAFVPNLGFANDSGANYGQYSPYVVYQMVDGGVAGHSYGLTNNMISAYGDGTEGDVMLYQDALVPAQGQYVSFDIPPGQAYARSYGNYVTWGVGVRHQPAADRYIVQLTSDSSGTYDNQITIYSMVGTTETQLANVKYTPTLDLTKRWQCVVSVKTNINPTQMTVTLTDVTDGITMSPPLTLSDSTASLQNPGSMELNCLLGNPYYDTVSFVTTNDPGPELASAPAVTASSGMASVFWSAAVGGTAPVSYVPQFVRADGFGFPTNGWSSASSTSSTGAALSALQPGLPYRFRIMVVDSSSPAITNFSPWATATP